MEDARFERQLQKKMKDIWTCQHRWPGQLQSLTPHNRRLHHWSSTLLLIVPQHSGYQSPPPWSASIYSASPKLVSAAAGRGTWPLRLWKEDQRLPFRQRNTKIFLNFVYTELITRRVHVAWENHQQDKGAKTAAARGTHRVSQDGRLWKVNGSARDYRQEIFGKFSNWV